MDYVPVERQIAEVREPVAIEFAGVNKWNLSPLHTRYRYTKNESLNSLIEFTSLFKRVPRLLGSFESAAEVDPGVAAALNDVSFEVARGSALAVVDPDGIGKQAVIGLAGRAVLANGGTVSTRGRVAYLGMLSSLVMGNLTARENLVLLCELLGLTERDLEHAIPEIVALVGARKMIDLPVRRIGQRAFNDLALATVCCTKSEIVAAEEILPMVLSPKLRAELIERFKANLEAGQTIVFSSRRLETIVDLSTHLLLIEDGRIVAHGPTEQVMDSHGTWTADAVEAASKILVNQVLIDEEDDDEMDPLDQEFDDQLLDFESYVQPDEAAAAKVERFGKLGFKQLGDLAYETRKIAACRFVESESDPIIFSHAMTPQPRKEDGDRDSKTIDPLKPFWIRFHVETDRPGVSIRPMVDLFSRRVAAVRAIAPDFRSLADPGRHCVSVEIPANLFADRMYLVNVAVLARDDASGTEDLLIERNLDYFYVGALAGPWAAGPSTAGEAAEPNRAPPLVQCSTEWSVETGAPTELLEIREATVVGTVDPGGVAEAGSERGDGERDGEQGEADTDADGSGEERLSVNRGETLSVDVVVETFQPNLALAAKVELLIDETLAVELVAAAEVLVQSPGYFNLRTEIPAPVLMSHSYGVVVSVRARSQAGHDRRDYVYALPVSLQVAAQSGDPVPGDRFHSEARPAIQAELPWRIEADGGVTGTGGEGAR